MIKGRNPEEQKIINGVFDYDQSHIFRFWDELNDEKKNILISEIKCINFDLLEKVKLLLMKPNVFKRKILPPEIIGIPETPKQHEKEKEAGEIGEYYLDQSKVSVFTAAGGQSSRIGLDIPKGAYPVTPIKNKSLFQVHAEKILYMQNKFNTNIPWIIMVSKTNREKTLNFFEKNNFFGLRNNYVRFIEQGVFPAIDRHGKIFLKEKHSIFLSPTGHGGTFLALRDSDAISWLEELGIEEIFYFQVDNVLVKILDPVFIGRHVYNNCEMSSKCVSKLPKEKIGIFAIEDDKTTVIEYSEFPDESILNGESKNFRAGNIAIHMINVKFAENENVSGLKLPFHLAHKSIPFIDETGKSVIPQKPNGYKFETFIFDALKDTINTIIMEVKREEEFSPLKNKSGINSPETVLQDQLRYFASLFEAAKINVPYEPDGKLTYKLEVSPLFAFLKEDFVKKIDKNIVINKETYIE